MNIIQKSIHTIKAAIGTKWAKHDQHSFMYWHGSTAGIKNTVSLRRNEINDRDFAEVVWNASAKSAANEITELKQLVASADLNATTLENHEWHKVNDLIRKLQTDLRIEYEAINDILALAQQAQDSEDPIEDIAGKMNVIFDKFKPSKELEASNG